MTRDHQRQEYGLTTEEINAAEGVSDLEFWERYRPEVAERIRRAELVRERGRVD